MSSHREDCQEIDPDPGLAEAQLARRSTVREPPLQSRTVPRSRSLLGVAPDRMLAVCVALILVAQSIWVVMHLLQPDIPIFLEATVELAVMLAFLLGLYYLVYRPFWHERQRREEEIRLLSRQLIRTEEVSRKNLARDLHDEFGQVLTALQFGVETICSSLTVEQSHLVTHCDRLSGMIASLGNHVRHVTAELRPTILDSGGLITALYWHARQFESMHPGIAVVVRAEEADDAARLAPEIEIALYRVCQESLNNVAKHARAHKVFISLHRTPKLLTLSIRDDGIGFVVDQLDDSLGVTSGFGILGMRERVADLGGQCDVVSSPGRGTEVRVALPLNQKGAVQWPRSGS